MVPGSTEPATGQMAEIQIVIQGLGHVVLMENLGRERKYVLVLQRHL